MKNTDIRLGDPYAENKKTYHTYIAVLVTHGFFEHISYRMQFSFDKHSKKSTTPNTDLFRFG